MPGLREDLLPQLRADLEEAIVDSGHWPALIERAARASGSEGVLLLRADGAALDGLATASVADTARRYFDEGWSRRDHRIRGLPSLRERGITVDQDFTSPDEFERLPFYQDLLAPRGLRWFAGIGFESGGRLWCLSLQRTVRQGPFEAREQARLAHLAPLLRRASILTGMVEAARLAGLFEAFDVVERAALVLDAEGRALRWNEAFGALLGRDLSIQGGRLVAEDPAAARALDALARPAGRPAVSVVAVRRRERPPLAVRVIPLAGPSRAVFSGASTLLLAGAPDAVPSVSLELLRAAYGLTPAEARLAQALADGASVSEAARRYAVSAETVRSQLKAIFAKTGTGRQAELVRLAAGLAG